MSKYGSKDDKKEEKKEESNLWNEFLRDSVDGGSSNNSNNNNNNNNNINKRKIKEGHLIIFGSNNCGKTSLVSSFSKLENKTESMKKFLMMRYSYVYLSSNDNDNEQYLLNIWQISEPQHSNVLLNVIPIKHMSNICYIIVLDLSKQYNVYNEYNKWIKCLNNIQNILLNRIKNNNIINNLKNDIYKHIQSYVNPKDINDDDVGGAVPDENDKDNNNNNNNNNDVDNGDSDDDNKKDIDEFDEYKEELKKEKKNEIKKNNPEINIGAPILIIGTKCDNFRKNYSTDADAEDHYEIMCSYLRLWGLKYGCSLFSYSKGQKEQSRRLLSYINHRVFNQSFNRAPNAVVRLSNQEDNFLFIPAGYDNIETINAQNPTRKLSEIEFDNYFEDKSNKRKNLLQKQKELQNNESKNEDNNNNDNEMNFIKPAINAKDDQTFLKIIEFDLMQGSSKMNPNNMSMKKRNISSNVNNTNPQKGDHQAVAKFFDKLLTNNTKPQT